jgi:peptidyl-prolyl cis-trans isomerase B (cyclophilin B)
MLERPLAALAVVIVLGGLVLAGCGDDDGSAAAEGPACTYSDDGRPAAKDVDPPPDHATVSGTVDATMSTSIGDLGLELDADRAPCTVNSFVSLAKQGYFDRTSCHRLTTSGIFVLQCGDPTGTGGGGPGYSFDDELTGKEKYPAGTLAMANAGPDTNGSQFFVVYGDTSLPPSYTVFGSVDSGGLAAVRKVARAGTDDANGPGDGHPRTAVDIHSVEVD